MEHLASVQTLYQLVIAITSNCGLDYVFIADTNLDIVSCVISSIDWVVDSAPLSAEPVVRNQPEVIATCEPMP